MRIAIVALWGCAAASLVAKGREERPSRRQPSLCEGNRGHHPKHRHTVYVDPRSSARDPILRHYFKNMDRKKKQIHVSIDQIWESSHSNSDSDPTAAKKRDSRKSQVRRSSKKDRQRSYLDDLQWVKRRARSARASRISSDSDPTTSTISSPDPRFHPHPHSHSHSRSRSHAVLRSLLLSLRRLKSLPQSSPQPKSSRGARPGPNQRWLTPSRRGSSSDSPPDKLRGNWRKVLQRTPSRGLKSKKPRGYIF